MRLKHGLATILLAALLLPLGASVASAARGMQVAVEDDGVFTGSYYGEAKGLARAAQLHASYVRVIVSWADVKEIHGNALKRKVPKRRIYSFSIYDGLVTRAARRHISVQLTLAGPIPAWASKNHHKSVIPGRTTARYFGEFAQQAAAHFRGRVSRFGIWNEPNFISWLAPARSAPANYRNLYRAAYAGIKRADPADAVLIGETSPYAEPRRAIAPLAFMRGVLCNGHCPLVADGYAHHPYDFHHSPTFQYPGGDNVTIGTLGRLNSTLAQWAASGALRTPQGGELPVYLTEFGYLSSGSARINDRKHAKYLVQAFQMAATTPNVRELVQYTLLPPRGRYAFFDMSILTKHGKPRLPFKALAAWAKTALKQGLISAR